MTWQAEETGAWAAAVDGAYAVIGLAGAPYFRKWKSREEFERVGTGGRVVANRGLVNAMAWWATLEPWCRHISAETGMAEMPDDFAWLVAKLAEVNRRAGATTAFDETYLQGSLDRRLA